MGFESFSLAMRVPGSVGLVQLCHCVEAASGLVQDTIFFSESNFPIEMDLGDFIAQLSVLPGTIAVQIALMQNIHPGRLLELLRSISAICMSPEVNLMSRLGEQKVHWDINEPGLRAAIQKSFAFRQAELRLMVPGDDRKGTLADAIKLLILNDTASHSRP
jgi:hypothetical protein